jgi:EAL domain-containing protein (putative c-di-GMP-specific phosphodiesterase class I)
MLLVEAARRIVGHVRESDTVAHLGGDEFTVIFTEVKELMGLEKVVQYLLKCLSDPYEFGALEAHASASIGIALYPYDGDGASPLLQHAEQAMYQAKRSGRSGYGYFTPSIQAEALKRQSLTNDLRQALGQKQFEVYYQPIVELKTGSIGKAEALIRWNHPERGFVAPDAFISLAEESGLIVEIGDWIYKEAARQTKRWQERYHREFQVSVNKSPVQFRSSNHVAEWIEYLQQIGLPGSNSVIEITESFLMEHEGQIAEKLMQLRDAGIEISLDDFGTGYSSLAYLQKFEIDYLKIDKSFVSHMTADASLDATLCEAIITMAHKLGIKVVAEGIETPFQRGALAGMECDYGQGYLFSKPVTAEAFEALLERGNVD